MISSCDTYSSAIFFNNGSCINKSFLNFCKTTIVNECFVLQRYFGVKCNYITYFLKLLLHLVQRIAAKFCLRDEKFE